MGNTKDIRQCYEEARTLLGSDPARAYGMFHGLAEQGDPYAMLQIAWANWQGLGIPQNTSSALEWYRRARISGGKDVQQSGRLGEGEAQVLQIEHPAQAFETFRELAEQGSPYLYAMLYLAEAYWRGRGIAPDKAAAVHWYQRAQRSDNPDIQRRARLEDRSEASMRQFYHWLGGMTSGWCTTSVPNPGY